MTETVQPKPLPHREYHAPVKQKTTVTQTTTVVRSTLANGGQTAAPSLANGGVQRQTVASQSVYVGPKIPAQSAYIGPRVAAQSAPLGYSTAAGRTPYGVTNNYYYVNGRPQPLYHHTSGSPLPGLATGVVAGLILGAAFNTMFNRHHHGHTFTSPQERSERQELYFKGMMLAALTGSQYRKGINQYGMRDDHIPISKAEAQDFQKYIRDDLIRHGRRTNDSAYFSRTMLDSYNQPADLGRYPGDFTGKFARRVYTSEFDTQGYIIAPMKREVEKFAEVHGMIPRNSYQTTGYGGQAQYRASTNNSRDGWIQSYPEQYLSPNFARYSLKVAGF